MKKPYLSIIVTGRNDNYGERFTFRLKLFFQVLLAQLKKYPINAEIVFVEWNPPQKQPKFSSEFKKWFPHPLTPIRVILVPLAIHQKFPNSEKMPLFEVIAKNAGIQRAKGLFILVTNPDILFPDKLIELISQKNLRTDAFYRVDRVDYKFTDVPPDLTPENIFRYAREKAFSLHTFGCAVKLRENLPYFLKIRLGLLNAIFMRRLIKRQGKPVFDRIHVNVSGDFILMANQHWRKLRGFPEKTTYSYIDGYVCFGAAGLGLRQVILDQSYSIFHLEHGRLKDLPYSSLAEFAQHYDEVLNHQRSPIFNSDHWGLDRYKLKETIIY